VTWACAQARLAEDGRGGVEAGGWPAEDGRGGGQADDGAGGGQAEGISRHVTSVGPVRLEVPVPSARHSGLRLFLRDLKGLLEYAFCGPGPTRQL
jgi:hypothetical protein